MFDVFALSLFCLISLCLATSKNPFTGKKSPVKPIFKDLVKSSSDMFAMESDNDLTPKVAPLRERIFDIPNIDD